jgi:L-2-hydroxyglutarate oxidase
LENHFDLGVVGGGIVGLATAYKYQLKYPEKSIAIFEKEDRVAAHQTGRNSGVIHSGIYYKPGSYKALNCVDGRKQLVSFARDHGIPHDVCGKIILATQESELPILDGIYKRGLENKIEGIRMIGPEEIQQLEPHSRGISAIHVPVTGIIDFKAVCRKLVELIQEINPSSKIFYNTEVTGIFHEGGQSGLKTSKGKFQLSQKVFCAGLQADRMARMEGIDLEMRIVGFRGDYYELSESGKHKVKDLIYPVPDPNFPFLGVHFTRMTDGSVECGPNAVFSFKREGYSRTAFDLKDSLEALSFRGTWKLFFKHPKKGIDEYRRAFSKKLFLKELQKMIPDLQDSDIVEGRSGVRAQAIKKDGSLVDDFHIRFGHNSVHVINAPSPAATACLSIADHIVERIEEQQSVNQ